MSSNKLLQQLIGVTLLIGILGGCTVRPIPSVSEAPPARAVPTLIPTATPDPTMGRIEGRVFRSDVDKPVANAEVELMDSTLPSDDPKSSVGKATTDDEGRYFFEIQPGRYDFGLTIYLDDDQSTWPCFKSAGFAGLGVEWTRDGYLAVLGEENSTGDMVMLANARGKDEIDVAGGEVLQKDIDVSCK